jgi:hypothetical protein
MIPEGTMSNAVAEGLFLLAFWAPPLAVFIGALVLVVGTPSPRRSGARARTVALTH